MKRCKHCGGLTLRKDGFIKEKQRYKCRDCLRTSREGDDRIKYSLEKRLKIIKLYLQGWNFQSIEKAERVSKVLVIDWLSNLSHLVTQQLLSAQIIQKSENLEILELDNLLEYCQEKLPQEAYGLLLLGNEMKLILVKKPIKNS